jgi:hypothetical protein
MLVSEILNQPEIMLEAIGPALRSLNVGKMFDILKQSERSRSIDKKFIGAGGGQGIGATSEVVDLGVLKKPLIGALRKAYKKYPNARAFAIYVDGKAIAFGKANDYTLAGGSREGVFAYNLAPLEKEIDAKHKADLDAAKTDYERHSIRKQKITNYTDDSEYKQINQMDKDEAIKTLLQMYKTEISKNNWNKESAALAIAKRLKREGKNWPELIALIKSAQSHLNPKELIVSPGEAFPTVS